MRRTTITLEEWLHYLKTLEFFLRDLDKDSDLGGA